MNKTIPLSLSLLVLLLFAANAVGLSSQEAVDFVSKQNNFLYPGETVEIFPNVKISYKHDEFFVVAVLSGSSLSGFIPVDDKEKEVPLSLVARRELLKTAYALRYFQQLKENSAKQGLWLFDAKNAKFFSDLSDDLKNERVDLTTVGVSLEEYSLLQYAADDLREQLDAMYPVADDIGSAVSAAVSSESGFFAAPDTNGLKRFQSKFGDAFEAMAGLEALRSTYTADLDELRQAVALTDLPIDTKQSLNRLMNVPDRLQQFKQKATEAIALEEQFDKIFEDALSNLEGLVAGLATREKRNSAFQVLYGQEDVILSETGQQSLKQLIDLILLEEYIFRWKEQGAVATVKANWTKAETFYNNGSFALAEQFAEDAKEDALRVYSAGLVEDSDAINTDLVFTGAALLIVALIVLYALRNRKKLAALVLRKEEEEELPAYGFEE